MGKVDQLVSSLQKLQAKRGVLDKQIADAEKKLAVEIKAATKAAAPAKKPVAKKPAAKKSAAKKPAAKKPAEE
jgi:DNA topoisomerase-1